MWRQTLPGITRGGGERTLLDVDSHYRTLIGAAPQYPWTDACHMTRRHLGSAPAYWAHLYCSSTTYSQLSSTSEQYWTLSGSTLLYIVASRVVLASVTVRCVAAVHGSANIPTLYCCSGATAVCFITVHKNKTSKLITTNNYRPSCKTFPAAQLYSLQPPSTKAFW